MATSDNYAESLQLPWLWSKIMKVFLRMGPSDRVDMACTLTCTIGIMAFVGVPVSVLA